MIGEFVLVILLALSLGLVVVLVINQIILIRDIRIVNKCHFRDRVLHLVPQARASLSSGCSKKEALQNLLYMNDYEDVDDVGLAVQLAAIQIRRGII